MWGSIGVLCSILPSVIVWLQWSTGCGTEHLSSHFWYCAERTWQIIRQIVSLMMQISIDTLLMQHASELLIRVHTVWYILYVLSTSWIIKKSIFYPSGSSMYVIYMYEYCIPAMLRTGISAHALISTLGPSYKFTLRHHVTKAFCAGALRFRH